MKILLVGPRADELPVGNHVTLERWARLLGELGHQPHIAGTFEPGDWDLLVALHARKSARAVSEFRGRYPDRPIIVALSGTDLYPDLRADATAMRTTAAAARLVVLQPAALEHIPRSLRERARVIFQSEVQLPTAVQPRSRPPEPGAREKHFEVCVIAHLRAVKDPLCAGRAARHLPGDSRIRVTLIGGVLEPELEPLAKEESETNARFRWSGPLPRAAALAQLAASDLLVSTSVLEGGANAVSEAIVNRVPVLATRIPGSVGLLGEEHPGYFRVGAEQELAALMYRTETDGEFRRRLTERCVALQPLFTPQEESRRWVELLEDLQGRGHARHS